MHQKDLNIVMQSAHELGISLPGSAMTAQMFNAMVGSGLGEDSIAVSQASRTTFRPAMKLFIGLGVMGRPMALRLLVAGHAVSVWARRPEAAAPLLAARAARCASAAEVARNSEVVFTIVTYGHDVDQVVFGEAGWRRPCSPAACWST